MTSPRSTARVRMHLSRDLSELSQMRDLTEEVICSHGLPVHPDLMLVMTELATNALLHAGVAPHEHIEVRVRADEEVTRVEVLDPGCAGGTLCAQDPGDGSPGGRGMLIVSRIASRWGSVLTPSGRTLVWADLA